MASLIVPERFWHLVHKGRVVVAITLHEVFGCSRALAKVTYVSLSGLQLLYLHSFAQSHSYLPRTMLSSLRRLAGHGN